MLCETCPAIRCEGYEYPEEYCLIRSEDTMIEFENGWGCRLHRKTIERMVKEKEEELSKSYEAQAAWYVLTYEIEKKPEKLEKCIDVLKRLLSMSEQKQYYHRRNRTFFKPLQISCTVEPTDSDRSIIELLYLAGLVELDPPDYWIEKTRKCTVTSNGMKWLGDRLDIEIKGAEKV